MRIISPVLGLLALAACATPQEQCISNATRELRVLNSLVAETEANVRRGYAIETVQIVEVVRRTCEGENEDGSTFQFPCEETETRERRQPVAIDLNAEQAKLTSLLERQRLLQSQAESSVAACRAAYPEG